MFLWIVLVCFVVILSSILYLIVLVMLWDFVSS